MITKQALIEFKAIYRQEYGIDLDTQTAMELAERLLMVFKVIYKPIKLHSVDKRKEEYGKQKDVK